MKIKIIVEDDFGVSHVTESDVQQSLPGTLNVMRSALWAIGFNYIDNVYATWGDEQDVSADDELAEEYNKSYEVASPANKKEKLEKAKNDPITMSTFKGDDGFDWSFNPTADHMFHQNNRMAVAFKNKVGNFDGKTTWSIEYYKDRELDFIKNWDDKDEEFIEQECEDYVQEAGKYEDIFDDRYQSPRDNVLPLFTSENIGWFNNKAEKEQEENWHEEDVDFSKLAKSSNTDPDIPDGEQGC